MSVSLVVDNITATTARLNYSSLIGSPSTIQVQVAARKDFSFCVAPLFTTPTGTPQTISGLNQAQTYFIRAQGVTAGGVQLGWSAVDSFTTPLSAGPDLTPPAIFLDPALICVPEAIMEIVNDYNIAGYPISNLLDDGPSVSVQAGQGGGSYFYYVFRAGGQAIDTIALLSTNMPEDSTAIIAYGSTQAEALSLANQVFTGPGRASANLPGRIGYHGLYRFTATAAKWWCLRIQCLTPGARMQAGHLIAGKSIVSKRIARDKSEALDDLGVIERNSFGVPDRLQGLRTRSVDFDLAMMDETIYETLYAPLHNRIGNTEPVLIVPNPKAGALLHDRILYGTMSGGRVSNPVSKFYSRRFNITSII